MIKPLSISVCLLLSITVQAQHSFSVNEAQEYGLQNNREMKNAVLEVGIASKQMKETISIGLPQINAEAQWQKFLTVPTTLVPAGAFGGEPTENTPPYLEMQFGLPHTTSTSVTASQLIFNGSYIVGLKASKSFMAFSRMRKTFTEHQIADSIATAYYNVLLAKENSDFLESIVEVHKTIVTEVEAHYNAGFVEHIEVDRMALVLSKMEMQYANMYRRVEIAEAYLKLLLGIGLAESLTLSDSLPHLLNTSISFKLEESNSKQRIEYQMAAMNTDLKELDLRRYQTDKLPTITAFGSINTSSMGDDFTAFEANSNWYPSQMVGLKISIPIFDGLGGSARIQKARLVWEQAKNDKIQMQETLALAHLSAKSNFINVSSDYTHQEHNLALAKKIYEKTLAKYREGLVSSLELSQAGTEYLQTNTNFSKSIYDLLITNLNYQRSLGK
jgi:outer membrane protein TolC